jgi:hypothetical protein
MARARRTLPGLYLKIMEPPRHTILESAATLLYNGKEQEFFIFSSIRRVTYVLFSSV